MDTTEVQTLLGDLTGNIDDLETSLEPLLKSSFSTTTSRLPLLDKAKLYVLVTYAIESILFSCLRLNGVDAKEHAVFRELTRVKEYFAKIKTAEAGPAQRSTTLDKGAAARFVKHGLAGNERYDQERRAREHGVAKRKADELEQTSQWGSHNRFESTAKRMRAQETMIPVVKASATDEDSGIESSAKPQVVLSKEEKKAAKRQRRMEAKLAKQSPASIAPEEQHDNTGDNADARSVPALKSSSRTHEASHPDPDEANQTTKKRKKHRKSRAERQQELEDKRAREME
ncbi:hypothetical protein AMS68_004346 [Peltaster fructicola]|uniref:Exosome complex protein n=1 Tax=Peltaster fructicola TaxID=286661 RepID=A0A6H0XW39_9PEZI|nr:hypothetical protein AMS68_004346 [Peltaster fructicola]